MAQCLTHEQVYKQINNGDIMFVANFNRLLARIIRFVTRSKYSHVGILFWVEVPGGQKRLMIIESQGGTTLRVQDYDYYCNRQLEIVASPKDWLSYEDTALKYVGQTKYGYLEAIYVGLRNFFFKYLGIRLPKKDFPGEICSEFVARCLDLDSVAISPQDLFDEIGQPVKFIVNG